MKKTIKTIFTFVLLSTMLVNTVACVPQNNSRNDGTKSEILVYNYLGGVGTVWLDKVVDRFETAFADYEFEEGKKGVIVEKKASKAGQDLSSLQNSNEDVFFSEWIDIPSLISQGKVLNIHDAVTTPLNRFLEGRTEDTQSIQDKLYPETVDFFTFREGQYYGLPHYSYFPTFTYNKALFDDKCLYFAKTPSGTMLEDKFITTLADEKSCGPDGILGNADDGLPATWDEMFELFDYMGKTSVIPLIYNGGNVDYFKYLINNAYINLVGKEVASYNYSFDSGDNTINIVTGWSSDASDASPTPGTAKVTSLDNYSALNKQLEKYYALEIVDRIVDTKRWKHDFCQDSTASALSAQFEYINSYNEGKPVAFLIEGGYWYNEAEDALYLDDVRNNHDDYDELNDYQILPMPRKYHGTAKDIEGTEQRKTVITDQSDSFACINAKIANDPVRVKIAKMFLAFCYTQESLAEFTETTNTVRFMNYEIDESKLGKYGKAVYSYLENSDILVPYSSHENYLANKKRYSFHLESSFWENTMGTPVTALYGDNKTVKAYFTNFMKK